MKECWFCEYFEACDWDDKLKAQNPDDPLIMEIGSCENPRNPEHYRHYICGSHIACELFKERGSK